MTIEKAIKYLEMWRECYRNSIDSCTAQAIGMAIEALENEADRKTEPSVRENRTVEDEPQTCETCKWGERYRKGYDITMMSDECGGCCSWNNKWKPKGELQTDCAWGEPINDTK